MATEQYKIYSEDLTRESVAWSVFIETELVNISFTS